MKDLVIIIGFDVNGNRIHSRNTWMFSHMRHLKRCAGYNSVDCIYQYTIDVRDLTVTRRTWVKDIHGQLHEATGIKPVV